jgi:hypothetical protein
MAKPIFMPESVGKRYGGRWREMEGDGERWREMEGDGGGWREMARDQGKGERDHLRKEIKMEG